MAELTFICLDDCSNFRCGCVGWNIFRHTRNIFGSCLSEVPRKGNASAAVFPLKFVCLFCKKPGVVSTADFSWVRLGIYFGWVGNLCLVISIYRLAYCFIWEHQVKPAEPQKQ